MVAQVNGTYVNMAAMYGGPHPSMQGVPRKSLMVLTTTEAALLIAYLFQLVIIPTCRDHLLQERILRHLLLQLVPLVAPAPCQERRWRTHTIILAHRVSF